MIEEAGLERLLDAAREASTEVRTVLTGLESEEVTDIAPLAVALLRLSWMEGFLEGAASAMD